MKERGRREVTRRRPRFPGEGGGGGRKGGREREREIKSGKRLSEYLREKCLDEGEGGSSSKLEYYPGWREKAFVNFTPGTQHNMNPVALSSVSLPPSLPAKFSPLALLPLSLPLLSPFLHTGKKKSGEKGSKFHPLLFFSPPPLVRPRGIFLGAPLFLPRLLLVPVVFMTVS